MAVLGSATPVPLRGNRVANVWIRANDRQPASLVLALTEVTRAHSATCGKVVLLLAAGSA
ncbi:hypothetical protein ABZ816_08845 [Actinosynnema sp. NPDC047251]|uniref:hypothetical protein n=1 Tax=Saccharothrix espanaensis TaxID=103731 RepID=UPI0002D26C61|nr:hypothetical protein [Saccharothrix espanaensis]